jgi:hypothetical protein
VIDEQDEQAFDEAVAAVREGKTIPVEAVREILRRL